MIISTGGIGSSDKGLAIFPQNVAAVLINRAATGVSPYISLCV
jgi:hypothetical protein